MSEVAPTAVRSGRSWRDISQEVKPRAMSKKGRRRQYTAWLKAAGITVLVCGLAYGLFHLVHEWETDRAAFADTVNSEPVRDIRVDSDGPLEKKWVEKILALPKGATLMALDLKSLRARLEAQGQVRIAVVTRDFPDKLMVTLQERNPVARIQAQDANGLSRQLLVAKEDGTVYDGTNYDQKMVSGLPWLDGIRLIRRGTGYAPIAGMADVADLLTTAQNEAPHLYRTWLIVSLAHLADRDEITVKARDVAEIIFSRKEIFRRQIAQLDYILEIARQQLPETGLRSVNLALAGQVPVKFDLSPEDLGKREYSPQFTLQPLNRKAQRDF